MKKRSLLTALLALLLLLQPAASARAEESETLTSGDYTFIVSEDGAAAITRYTGVAVEMEVPAELAGYPVTRICSSAFALCTSLESVSLPEGLTELESGAFMLCNNLREVSLPASLVRVEGNPFNGPSPVELSLAQGNPVLALIDGVLFDEEESRLLWYPVVKSEDTYVIPAGTKEIGRCAFAGCKSLRELQLPEGLRVIGDLAFNMCDGLERLTIPDTVTSLGLNPFAYCQGLTDLVISPANPAYLVRDGVVFTKDGTLLVSFLWTKPDTAYTIPVGTERIGAHAFRMNQTLRQVTVPEGVTAIGMMAFAFCTNLQELLLPESVTEFEGQTIFSSCPKLTVLANPHSAAAAYCAENEIACVLSTKD